ncbi:MAG: hypothetical protein OEV65_03950 [Aquincola sp.]|nr:hypothetical protein [Aquincola sp.]
MPKTTFAERAATAVLASLAASGALGADLPHPFRVDIAAGKIGEVCMALDEAQTLAWRFKASDALDFNLHHHVGSEVLIPVEYRAVREHRGHHLIDRRNDWCLMWTAPKGKQVTVEGQWTARPPGAPK